MTLFPLDLQCWTPRGWAWANWLRAGTLTVLSARSDAARLLCDDLLRRNACGEPWPDGEPTPRRLAMQRVNLLRWADPELVADEVARLPAPGLLFVEHGEYLIGQTADGQQDWTRLRALSDAAERGGVAVLVAVLPGLLGLWHDGGVYDPDELGRATGGRCLHLELRPDADLPMLRLQRLANGQQLGPALAWPPLSTAACCP